MTKSPIFQEENTGRAQGIKWTYFCRISDKFPRNKKNNLTDALLNSVACKGNFPLTFPEAYFGYLGIAIRFNGPVVDAFCCKRDDARRRREHKRWQDANPKSYPIPRGSSDNKLHHRLKTERNSGLIYQITRRIHFPRKEFGVLWFRSIVMSFGTTMDDRMVSSEWTQNH